MPLDHVNGERVEGMDLVYRVVPIEKYQQLPGLTTLVEKTTGSFYKKKTVESLPIWKAATDYAQIAFKNSGAPAGPLHYDMLAQEYPAVGVVCFVFCAKIFGRELYVQAPFQLTDEQIAEMKVIGEWDSAPAMN
jgi:hypothetical protein